MKHILWILASAATLQAQTVSTISLGHPSCAIIEGKIVEEGTPFKYNGNAYVVKKISADSVTVANKDGNEETLVTGAAPTAHAKNSRATSGKPTNNSRPISATASKAIPRATIEQQLTGKKKADVTRLLGAPATTQQVNGRDTWVYHNVSSDPAIGRPDATTVIIFGSGKVTRTVPVVSSSTARVGGGGGVSGGGTYETGKDKDEVENIEFSSN